MDTKFFVLALAMGCAINVNAAYTFSFYPGNASIPDGNANGYQNSVTLADVPGAITDVNVTLGISGGFNGDLYVWLSHDSALSVLLDRVGVSSANSVGYANAGFGPGAGNVSFTLDDQAAQDVHFYQSTPYLLNSGGQLTGRWQPDGRTIDPASPPGLFDPAPRPDKLVVFDGLNPNGQWTLYVADLSPGGVSALTSWGLQIEVVPEPRVVNLAGLGCMLLLWRYRFDAAAPGLANLPSR